VADLIKTDIARIKADIAKVDAALAAVAVDLTRELSQKTGDEVVVKIQERVAKGNKLPGGKFRRYAASTVAQRKKQGLQTSPVNLRVTNDMLGSLHYKQGASAGTGEVNVSGTQAAKAAAHHFGKGHLPARPWMGLTKKDAKAIGGLLGAATTKIVRRHEGDAYVKDGKGYEGKDQDILAVVNP